MSHFESLSLLPDDPILSLTSMFNNDSKEKKVNLGVGAYKTVDCKPYVLECVREAEGILLQKKLNKEYIPIDGLPEYNQECLKLLFKESSVLKSGAAICIQTIGGTGALRIGGEILALLKTKTLYMSNPTWPNHKGVFGRVSIKLEIYPYYNAETHLLDFDKLCEAIKKMEPGSAILLHACCHNPTGIDPTVDQWKELSTLIKKQRIIPFFDLAYQGFGDGIDEDAFPVRYFAEQGHEMLVAGSFSKNFGLYGERVGYLAIVTSDKATADKVSSNIKNIIRESYSNPPSHGARIVTTILQNPELRKRWLEELANMRDRVKEMRVALVSELLAKEIKKVDFSFMFKQRGLFSFSGLNEKQVLTLRNDWGIYMPPNGRINVAGLNTENIDYVVQAIVSVL